MAEEKKGFVLYADLIHMVKQLPDDKAGLLLKHILSYINDEKPTTDDIIVKIAFEPIKQQLKRDLKKYELAREQRVKAGKASAEARRNRLAESTSVESRSTKPTVIGKGTVTVKGIVTGKVIKKENKPNELVFPYDSEMFMEIWGTLATEKKWRNKSDSALQASLKILSKYSEGIAIEMIEKAIAGEWQGFVEPKTFNNGTKKQRATAFIDPGKDYDQKL